MKRVDGKLAESAHLLMPIESGSFRNITKQMSSLAATSHGYLESWISLYRPLSNDYSFFVQPLAFCGKRWLMAYLGHWKLQAIDRLRAGLLLPQCLGSRFSAASMVVERGADWGRWWECTECATSGGFIDVKCCKCYHHAIIHKCGITISRTDPPVGICVPLAIESKTS